MGKYLVEKLHPFFLIQRCVGRLLMILYLVLVSKKVLKWGMTRVPDGMHLQEYTPNANIPPPYDNKFLLQIDMCQAITLGYKIYSHKSSTSSHTSSW